LRIRDVLNKILWCELQHLQDYEIHIVHRGCPGDVKVIPFSMVTGVFRGCFTYRDQGSSEDVVIPFHRVILVRNRLSGEVLFERRR